MSKTGDLYIKTLNSETEAEEMAEKVAAHRNRRRQFKEKSVRSLNRMLDREFDVTVRQSILRELNRRYGHVYRLRMKG